MWVILALVLFCIGAVGVVLPVLPGIPIAWLGLFIYAYAGDFSVVSFTTTMVFLGLTVLTLILDFVLPIWGLKRFKPSRAGVVGSLLGLVIGIFVSGPLGFIIGPLVGAFLGELYAGREFAQALKVSGGTALGFFLSAFLKLTLIAIMFGYFVVFVLIDFLK